MDKYITKKEIKENNINKIYAKIHNKKYINKTLKKYKKLFDNINGYPLDNYQKKAIINDEYATLLIASAGSGKTLTIVGKIRYLIEVLGINKKEILCISFTNDSVNSLKNALIKNYNYDIDVYTFHKLSLNIINNNKMNISICESNLLSYIIDEFFICNLKNKKLYNSDCYKKIKDLIITFINLFKSNNYNIDKFNEIIKDIKYSNEYILIKIIKYIYIEYETELKSTNKVDFNDMINYAYKIIKENGYINNYKYIIIDEYQDTSYTKYKLINEIINKLNAKLFVVGDDFQSIYRFTGCNLDIFLKFKKYFKYSTILKLKNTYRNSNQLIKVSSDFIMKNNNQMKKNISSNKNLDKPIIIVYTNNKEKTLLKLINNIDTNILLLGRNNNDLNKIIRSTKLPDKVKYLTIHKSKGLEEDNVIIINLEDSIMGFPSKIENNKILRYVLKEKDIYPYEEERRLFYVALTRTKNFCYLLVDKKSESIFVKEIKKEKNVKIMNI